MENLRIGNLEYRKTASITGHAPYFEIVKWYPNSFYGSEKKMKADGWTFDEDGNARFGCSTVHGSCFKSEFCSYTVAFVEWNGQGDEYDIRSVGRRAFELDEEDRRSLYAILDRLDESGRGDD